MNRSDDTIRMRKVERLVKARRLVVRACLLAGACGAAAFGWVQLTQAESLAIKQILVEGTGPERAEEIRGLDGVATVGQERFGTARIDGEESFVVA